MTAPIILQSSWLTKYTLDRVADRRAAQPSHFRILGSWDRYLTVRVNSDYPGSQVHLEGADFFVPAPFLKPLAFELLEHSAILERRAPTEQQSFIRL